MGQGFAFLHLKLSVFWRDSGGAFSRLFEVSSLVACFVVMASFTQSSGSPHSLHRVHTERIWLAEVEPHALHASMSLPVSLSLNCSWVAAHSRHRQRR
jgi:hypothetical protein